VRDELLDVARVGFASMAVGPSTQERALEAIGLWLEDPRFVAYRAQLVALIEASRWTTLIDSFYRTLPFGTGGRRGPVGIGPNRFNPWTFATSVQGHAVWLRASEPEGPLMVVIGYDVRQFLDVNGQLVADINTPVSSIRSRDFAEIAAEIYAAHEITAVLPEPEAVLSTPELSFAIRDLQASGGLVISASHNPPDDNGSKFYHGHGGQFVPPHDQALADTIAAVDRVERMPFDRGVANGLIRDLDGTVHDRYIAANLSAVSVPDTPWVPMVFTPLHGTAHTSVGDLLEAAGVPVTPEPEQSIPDGRFPTVPFKSPNPESAEALDQAIRTAQGVGAHLVMGCDPDADRLGVAVLHQGQWRTLNGHDIAALVTQAALNQHSHPEPLVLKTDVTTQLVTRIAESHGAEIVDDLLVGFKHIGDALFMLERKGRFQDVDGDVERFAAGVEESHGVLITAAVRDKDAAGGALLLAAMASTAAAQGRTLVDELNALMATHGVFANHLGHLVLHGAVGRARIDQIMASLRTDPPAEIGGVEVTKFIDRQAVEEEEPPTHTERMSRDMLSFVLADDTRVTVRPSGTEPKLKLYVETTHESVDDPEEAREELMTRAHALVNTVILTMMNRIDVVLPPWALDISDRVNLDTKIEWSNRLVPALLEQLELAPDTAGAWLRARLDADERALLRPGIESLIKGLGFDHPTLWACFTEPVSAVSHPGD
jgi:phosphoglucomutase